jgi:hypothetical protein
MARSVAFLPRLVVITVVWLLLTAALTYAAGTRLTATTSPVRTHLTTTTTPPLAVLTVPDVDSQPYVFAKGILEDAGFAWKVTGAVKGYAANVVVSQLPAAGTRVIDTGAPTVVLQLAKGSDPQTGTPEDAAPFAGTRLELAKLATSAPAPTAVTRKPSAAKAVTTKPAVKKTAVKKPAKQPQKRPPAFTVVGARPEPLDEVPLPVRAQSLLDWLGAHPQATTPNVKHWLYQHAWIVTGAREGWWHGAQALELLIQVDRRAESVWGIGSKSEAVARAALAEVKARSR